jgi:hypothetical protein
VKLDRRLNLVFEVPSSFGPVHVHSVPVSRETFEAHFLLIAKLFAKVYNDELGSVAGPRVAALLLKKLAADDRDLSGQDEALLQEVRRLTNVTFIQDGRWTTEMFEDVIEHDLLDRETITEVENILVYFTLASSMLPRERVAPTLALMGALWLTQTTSLGFTEWAASLATAKTADATSKKAAKKTRDEKVVAGPPDATETASTSLSQVPH